jgi:hypothetical protein
MIMKKLIVVATAVGALAVGTAAGLTLYSTANPKVAVSCEGNSCSVQLPGALLDEMNRTVAKSLPEPAEAGKADGQAFLKELGRLFEQPPTEHDSKLEDSEADMVREVEKIFQQDQSELSQRKSRLDTSNGNSTADRQFEATDEVPHKSTHGRH